MKIINICPSNHQGGMEQSFINFSNVLHDNNHQIYNIITKKFAQNYRKKLPKGHIICSFFAKKVKNIFLFCALFFYGYYFWKIKPDFVVTHNARHILLLNILKKLFSFKLITFNHSSFYRPKQVDANFTICVCKHVIKYYDQQGHEAFYLPNCIEIPSSQDKSIKLTNAITIGTLARLDNEKGVDVLIDAFRLLKADQQQIKLVIAGAGKEEQNLKKLVREYKLESQIEFCGWVDNSSKILNKLDIYCQPSREESFGIAIIEAMAHNLPVVATKCKGPLTIITNNFDGVLVDINHPKQLADAIKNLIENNDFRLKLTTKARETVKQNFSSESFYNNFLKIIESNNQ